MFQNPYDILEDQPYRPFFFPPPAIRSESGSSGHYEKPCGINCSFCWREPNETEELVCLSGCGHILCRNCFDFLRNSERQPKCPLCHKDSNDLK